MRGGLQFGDRIVAQAEQVMGIQLRITQRFFFEGALAPVGALELLVQLHAVVMLQHIGQPHAVVAENAHGPHGVEEIGQRPAEIPQQQHQIILSGMENLLDARIFNDGAQTT